MHRRMLQLSPTALACLKAALNADEDGQAGVQELAGMVSMCFYVCNMYTCMYMRMYMQP